MSQTPKVIINGREYDPLTGLVVGEAAPVQDAPVKAHIEKHPQPILHSAKMHATTQKSQLLRRSALAKPQPARTRIEKKQIAPLTTKPSPIVASHTATKPAAKSPIITKFAPQPSLTHTRKPRMMDIAPAPARQHPQVVKAYAVQDAKAAPAPVQSAQSIKQQVVQQAIDNTVKNTELPKMQRHPRVLSIITAAVALVILGGYLTYLNMPSLSVRVAAAEAGINASYPDYHPDGYSLNGPVAYDQGQVSMKFAANGGPQSFTIKQTKSNWDSSAVLDDYVTPKAGTNYITYTESGLTIYTFNGNAAWVNGGILYTIDGNAPLSSEQIRHIATSFL